MSIVPDPESVVARPDRFSLQGIALASFLARSTATPRRLQTVTGFFEELLVLYFQSTNCGSSLQRVTSAAALVAYGIRENCNRALSEARNAYNLAIGELSQELALSSPHTPAEATVLSVLLCLWYEVCRFPRSFPLPRC